MAAYWPDTYLIGPLQLAITWLDSAMLESKLCSVVGQTKTWREV